MARSLIEVVDPSGMIEKLIVPDQSAPAYTARSMSAASSASADVEDSLPATIGQKGFLGTLNVLDDVQQ